MAEIEEMHEDDLLELIRETVSQLNNLGDRLESYAKKEVGSAGDRTPELGQQVDREGGPAPENSE